MSEEVRKELLFPHAPERVWQALARAEGLAGWMYPNDFEPRVGHRFTFQVPPNPKLGFDGTVRCRVLACRPPALLSYTWSAGPLLESTVTFRLEPAGTGTRVHFAHAGFDVSEGWGKAALRGAEMGWDAMLEKLGDVITAAAG